MKVATWNVRGIAEINGGITNRTAEKEN